MVEPTHQSLLAGGGPRWAEVVKRYRRMGFGGGCLPTDRLSNAGSACKDILDLGFSPSRTRSMLYEFKD